MGLFLGASAFTVLEFLQFGLFIAGKYCFGWGLKKKGQGEVSPKQESNVQLQVESDKNQWS